MKAYNHLRRFFGTVIIFFALSIFILPDFAEARRGGGSFGGSRSFKPRPAQTAKPKTSNVPRQQRTSSFGGTRISKEQAKAKYGIPKKVEQTKRVDANGNQRTYNIHNYDGYANGLMTGYLLGHTSWLWMMPFHPAFYYSKPYYVENEDGSIDVYPPTFSIMRLLIGIALFSFVIWLVYRLILANRKVKKQQNSSFV
ncbi:MAG TPA: hypothetical protein PLU67_04795 [Candidatus Kapabacteria bacterium]|jgi:hypothetical protein|nr:hypothetical protein [Candidatus Kapabacteria bacterium]HOM04797.1 hypothetical protein [Candidatus Kapabacteria bacterium]HPP39148.1 hypothetical protein [Candidatus Kapabacteria bacterium]